MTTANKLIVTPPMPLKTCAWYVGRWCHENDNGWFEQPYSRETEYYATREEAERALTAMYDEDEITDECKSYNKQLLDHGISDREMFTHFMNKGE